jgi:glycerol-3-phosphate O-acyltransferase 1/2
MSTNVVAFLLLNKFRDGCSIDSLVEAFDEMRHQFEMAQRETAFCGETIDIVNHAVSTIIKIKY